MYDDDGDMTLQQVLDELERLGKQYEEDGKMLLKIRERIDRGGNRIRILVATLRELGYSRPIPVRLAAERPEAKVSGKGGKKTRRPRDSVRERDARGGVKRVSVQPLGNGAVLVKIDDQPVRLPRTRARLFEILCENKGKSRDHLVGWKSAMDIRRQMGKKEKPISQSTLTTNISRLRDSLHDANINWMYVQQDDELGYRFAVAKRRVTGRALR